MSEERRTQPKFREVLAFHKEVPVGWLATFLGGGLVNFAILVWMASTVVSDVGYLKTDLSAVKTEVIRLDSVSNANAADSKTQASRLDDHGHRLDTIENRLNSRR